MRADNFKWSIIEAYKVCSRHFQYMMLLGRTSTACVLWSNVYLTCSWDTVEPCHWNIEILSILNLILRFMGSQCNCLRIGVMGYTVTNLPLHDDDDCCYLTFMFMTYINNSSTVSSRISAESARMLTRENLVRYSSIVDEGNGTDKWLWQYDNMLDEAIQDTGTLS